MKQRESGHIVNIASTAAKRAWANASAYHASKWGLLGFSYALHVEARPHKVKVTAVIAGGMQPPFILDRSPWQVPHRLLFQDVPCKDCYKSICPEGHHNCLRQVSPAAIVTATCELLDEQARSPLIFHAPPSMLSTRLI